LQILKTGLKKSEAEVSSIYRLIKLFLSYPGFMSMICCTAEQVTLQDMRFHYQEMRSAIGCETGENRSFTYKSSRALCILQSRKTTLFSHQFFLLHWSTHF